MLLKNYFSREKLELTEATDEPIGEEKELDDADDIGTKSKQEENHSKVLYICLFLLF